MPERYPAKQHAMDYIDENRGRLSDFDLEIWSYHEPAWREYRSARAYCDFLRDDGWEVEEGSGEMPTAFTATFRNGDGPVIGGYAEYDAVPGNSQQAVPYRAPREGMHPWAAGHTDPHSMLGVAGLSGFLAAKAAMQKHDIPGTLVFFGEPAEKVCGSKPVHAAKGYYDGFDAFIAYHPHASNTAVWETHCGSYWSVVVTFECEEPEQWIDPALMPEGSSSHAVARAPGAIDALCLMYTTTKYTKEAMFPKTGTWTLNEFVLAGGDATSDNLPPRFSQIQYSWRSPELNIQEQIYRVIEQNARHVASMTQCKASIRWVTKTRVGLANLALADLTYRNLEQVGAPEYSEDGLAFAREIQSNLGLEPIDNPLPESNTKLLNPRDHESRLRTLLPEWQTNFTSDDYVEYCWHAPTVRLLTARPSLRPPEPGYAYPAWCRNAMGGVAELIDPGMFVAGKTIAGTVLDLLTDEDELRKCQSEFQERTGGGVGGSQWVEPLLEKEFVPPVDLRWPEYVQTVRGEEWWIPTPDSRAGMGERL